jgi:hypothetical protein
MKGNVVMMDYMGQMVSPVWLVPVEIQVPLELKVSYMSRDLK